MPLTKKPVFTDQSAPIGAPYSQAIVIGDLVYCSGIIPQKPDGEIVRTDIQSQTRVILSNVANVLKASGSDIQNLVKVNVYLRDMADFDAMNKVYDEILPNPKPARTCIQPGRLPKDVDIEIECVAHL
ncbi:uncharacterized protein VTP21DRAFT_5598 [Calcarisporiella thermophila]|uniref:uncharacterized protein n=1 Tax=Calcarisporiella thermophila TaxID=911321 RepID=UPI003741F4F7